MGKTNGFKIEKYYNDSSKEFEIRISSKDHVMLELLFFKVKEWLKT